MALRGRQLAALAVDLEQLRARLGAATATVDAKPARWASAALGVTLDDWQAEIMEADSHRICVIASRQSGKSTVTAARAAYTAARSPAYRIVLVSPTFRQSSALRSKVLGCLQGTGVGYQQTREEIRLLNGSTIRALPGDDPDKVRGATADLVIIDECAFVKDNVAAAVLPMLASTGGELIAVSTPNGPQGLFHELATAKDVQVIKVPAERISRFDADTIADLRLRLGPARASQELDCAFVVANRSIFDANALAAMFGETSVDGNVDLETIQAAAEEEERTLEAEWQLRQLRNERMRQSKGWPAITRSNLGGI